MIKSQRECLQMIDEIEQRGVDLTEWETDFIDSVSLRTKFSNPQKEVIDSIYNEKVPHTGRR